MTVQDFGAIGFGLAAVVLLIISVLLLTRWRNRPKSPILGLAAVVTFVWACTAAGVEVIDFPLSPLLAVAGLLRGLVWLTVMFLILRSLNADGRVRPSGQVLALASLVAAIVFATIFQLRGASSTALLVQVTGGLVFGCVLVVLSEQVFRRATSDAASDLRYFCLAIAGAFLYDIVLYGLAVSAGRLNETLWAACGYVNAILALPLLYSVRRRFNLSVDTLLTRQIVFYSFSLAAIGVLLLAIFAGDYYIQSFDGSWSGVVRIVFAFAVLSVAAVLIASPSIRATTRVLITKALFQYKYDYRREWLRFIATLSQSTPDSQVPTTAVRAVAQIVNSPGGAVWARPQPDEDYVLAGIWNCDSPANHVVPKESALVAFLKDRQWVIDLDEMQKHPARYEGYGEKDFPDEQQDWWLIVPMLLGDRLSGFILLLRPNLVPVLNFEDHDLLKTAGRHVATHIEQAETDRRLAEASQFGAYNRLTAFLMHDLNNLVAQQQLVVENAERFRHNQQFVDDAFGTIANSVDRMRRLMEQLSAASKPPTRKRVNLSRTINIAVKRTSSRKPVPQLVKCDFDIHVEADTERLSMVLEHLVRNAQEATPPDGDVSISVGRANGMATIAITDTGSGMTQEFIQTRLFRPFDSTKGIQGMGIGVYQAREYARALGGHLEVSSEPGQGTEFRILLPTL